MNTDVITAPATKSCLPAPALTEDGHVLTPCTVECFPAPHPDWTMQVGNKDLDDHLLKDLPIVPGVTGNRSTALLSLGFDWFIPKEQLSDPQAHLQMATNIQVALWKALIHPAVEGSLLPAPDADHHLGLVTMEDLRCLSSADRENLKDKGVEFFFPVLRGHLVEGTKIQQYLLSCLIFGWYPSHFHQKKVAKETRKQLTRLADRITELDGGSDTFQSCQSITICPFKDCLFMCSSQYAAVKHAMRKHYRTWMVCGSCLCHFAPSFSTSVAVGRTLISFKEHVMMCGNLDGLPVARTSAGKVSSTRSTPVSISSSIPVSGDNAGLVKDDTDSAGGVGGADNAQKAIKKCNLAAVFGSSTNGSDVEEETVQASKKQNRAAVFGGQDDPTGKHPSKRFKKARK